jgi:hypothetical protein
MGWLAARAGDPDPTVIEHSEGHVMRPIASRLVTVGAPPIAGHIGVCQALRDIRRPVDHWTPGEILPVSAAEAFARSGIPAGLRHGSPLGGVVRDGIATTGVYDRSQSRAAHPSSVSLESRWRD